MISVWRSLSAGQADLLDVGQVGPLGEGLGPAPAVVEVAAGAVVPEVLRAQQVALEAADELQIPPRRVHVRAALRDDEHVAPGDGGGPVAARPRRERRLGEVPPTHGVAHDVVARPGAGGDAGDAALLEQLRVRQLPVKGRADAVHPVEPGEELCGLHAGGPGEQGPRAGAVLEAPAVGRQPRVEQAGAAGRGEHEAGLRHLAAGVAAGQLARDAAEVVPAGDRVPAQAQPVDAAVGVPREEIADLVVAGGRLLQDVEVPQQAAGVDDLGDAVDDAGLRVVVPPRRRQERRPSDVPGGARRGTVGLEQVVQGPQHAALVEPLGPVHGGLEDIRRRVPDHGRGQLLHVAAEGHDLKDHVHVRVAGLELGLQGGEVAPVLLVGGGAPPVPDAQLDRAVLAREPLDPAAGHAGAGQHPDRDQQDQGGGPRPASGGAWVGSRPVQPLMVRPSRRR